MTSERRASRICSGRGPAQTESWIIAWTRVLASMRAPRCAGAAMSRAVLNPIPDCPALSVAWHVANPPLGRCCIQVVHVVDDFRFSVGSAQLRLCHWQRRIPAEKTAPRLGGTMSPSSMYHKSARPPFICNGCCGSSVSVSFSGAPSWKLAVSCTLVAWSACNRCSSDGSSTPIHGRLPAACRAVMPPTFQGLGCTPDGRRRQLALHLNPSALVGALLVQHEFSCFGDDSHQRDARHSRHRED